MKHYFSLLLLLLLLSLKAVAGVMPDKSRIIYHQQNTAEAVMLVNTNHYPVMVQLWIDDGELKNAPETVSSPFVVTPAVLKLNQMQLNSIKVIFSGEKEQLPQDRESLFWLNIFEIPPKPENTPGEEKLTLSMLTQVKIIYRPTSLNDTASEVIKQLAKLSFKLDKSKSDVVSLTIQNPTPYIASFASITLEGISGKQNVILETQPEIDLFILPMSSQTFRFDLSQQPKTMKLLSINYTLINDQGQYRGMKLKI